MVERGFGLSTCFPRPAPDQCGLDGLDEGAEGQKTVWGAVFPTNPPDPPVPHIDPDPFQFLRHPRPVIAAKAQARLFLDVNQSDHVCALPAAGRAAAKSS